MARNLSALCNEINATFGLFFEIANCLLFCSDPFIIRPFANELPQRGQRTVNALLTGMHEPEAAHLAILETLAWLSHVKTTYDAALKEGYLWHEFGIYI